MKVILLEDITNLGRMGDTVTVKAGYARNYLIPRKLALVATAQNLKAQQNQLQALEKRKEKVIEEAKSLSEKLAGAMLSFSRKCGSKGQLFGSVTNMDIATALEEQGLEVDRRDIVLTEPIKSIGDFDVTVKLHHDVAPVVKVTVLPEGGVIPESVVEEAVEGPAEAAAETAPEAAPVEEPAPEVVPEAQDPETGEAEASGQEGEAGDEEKE